MVVLQWRRARSTVHAGGTVDVEIIYTCSWTINDMSVWIGAHQVVQDALSAVAGAWTWMRQGGSTRPDSMEQLALVVKRAAVVWSECQSATISSPS